MEWTFVPDPLQPAFSAGAHGTVIGAGAMYPPVGWQVGGGPVA